MGSRAPIDLTLSERCLALSIPSCINPSEFSEVDEMARSRSFLAVPLLGLLAWAGPGHAASLACPPAGVEVTRASGEVVQFKGADPTNPKLCITSVGEKTSSLIYGIFNNDILGRKMGDAVEAIYAQGIGSKSSFENNRNNNTWVLTFQLETQEKLRVGSEDRDTYRVRYEQKGVPPNWFNAVWTYWIDQKTNVVLKRGYEAIRGQPLPNQEYSSTRLVAPR